MADSEIKINCTEGQYHDLWVAFHDGHAKKLKVSRIALENALTDLKTAGQKLPTGLVAKEPRKNGKEIEVHRDALWEFLQQVHEVYCEWESQGSRLPE